MTLYTLSLEAFYLDLPWFHHHHRVIMNTNAVNAEREAHLNFFPWGGVLRVGGYRDAIYQRAPC